MPNFSVEDSIWIQESNFETNINTAFMSMTMQQEYKNLFFVFLFVFVFYHFHSTEPPPPPPKTSKIQNFAFFQNFHIWFKFLFHHFWTWFWFCNVPWAMSVLGRTKKLTLFWIVKVKITQFVWKKSNKICSKFVFFVFFVFFDVYFVFLYLC